MAATTLPSTNRTSRPAARASLAFALSLGVHLLFFGLLAVTLQGEPRPVVIPIELVFAPAGLDARPAAAAAPELADDEAAASATVASTSEREAPTARPRLVRATPAPERPARPALAPLAFASIVREAPVRIAAPGARTERADRGLELAVHDWLRRHQHYPRAARRAGLEGTATVRFVIDRRGALRARELVASSGHAALDRAALELLERAAPYPALPARAALEAVELTLPVEYRLKPDATRG